MDAIIWSRLRCWKTDQIRYKQIAVIRELRPALSVQDYSIALLPLHDSAPSDVLNDVLEPTLDRGVPSSTISQRVAADQSALLFVPWMLTAVQPVARPCPGRSDGHPTEILGVTRRTYER